VKVQTAEQARRARAAGLLAVAVEGAGEEPAPALLAAGCARVFASASELEAWRAHLLAAARSPQAGDPR
jgi:hypothetical protein